MLGLLKKIFGMGSEAAAESEPEIDIDYYYQRLTSSELDSLVGKWITLVFRDGKLKGKIKPSSMRRADGYFFVTRVNERLIVQLWRFWPGNWERTEMFNGAGIYRDSDGKYFTAGDSLGAQYHNKSERFIGDYDRMEKYLEEKKQ